MPRNQQPGTTLRNRNRVTNKTRLKILRGSIDADPLIMDEEEERARVIATSGVDAEDANEHHLQVAINAAAQRHSTFGNDSQEQKDKKRDLYIPTPDATGVASGYAGLYPPNKWARTTTYLKFSDTVEDTVSYALSNAYSYFMDERDNEWLEKNNQDAKGEGTSSQPSGVGTTTRASRNSKSKGKEPESPQPISMTEDEFELIMGLLERMTDDRYPCLHVDPSQMPVFTEFEPVFSSELPVWYFSSYVLPPFMPPAPRAVSLARLIYPHWRDRRLECGGRRIIPQLNDDETNDSDPYVCFRRRDSKPVRKTRASQTTITDRLLKLKAELGQAHALATELLRREEAKQTSLQAAQAVWHARQKLADVKRRYGQPPTKEEEEMLFDKERAVKKQRTLDRISTSAPGGRSRNNDSPIPNLEARMWPKERMQKIHSEINEELAKQRDRSSSWEDLAEHPLQHPSLSTAEKMFSSVTLDDWEDFTVPMDVDPVIPREPRFLRLRSGRGGRLHIDRMFRSCHASTVVSGIQDESTTQQVAQWKFDCDSITRDELDDRFFVDDYDPRYLRHSISLLSEEDRSCLSVDIPMPPSQPLFDPNRTIVGRLAQRRGVDDLGRISQTLRLSPPPTPILSAQVPSQIRGPQVPPRLPTTANGVLPPTFLTPTKSLNTFEQSSPTHAEDAMKVDGTNPIARVGVPAAPTNIAMSLGESSSFNTPAISRQHRLQVQHHQAHSPHSALPNGSINGGFGPSGANPQIGGDLTPQQIMQLKQAYASNQLSTQSPSAQGALYQAMSPPSRPQSRLQSMVGAVQPGQPDASNLVASHMNMRHPGKIPRRGSPQINGDLMSTVAAHSPHISSPLVPHNVSPLLRAPSTNGNHMSPPHGNIPTSNGFTGMAGSPQLHVLPRPSTPGVLVASPTMHPPTRPPSTIPISSHHAQHINGLGQTPSF